jgi:uncharacterized membrane protein YebE (DUF533 family)
MDARRLLGAMIATGMGGRNQRFDTSGGIGAGGIGGVLGSLGGIGAAGGSQSLSRGRSAGGLSGAVGGGALGMLAGLAISAMQNRQGKTPMQPTGSGSPDKSEGAVSENSAMLLIRAMIAAANADGQIDKDERHRITQKLEEGGIDSDDRAFVEQELRAPQSLDTLIQQVHGQEEAGQVYAASLFAISVDKESERSYLKYLADRLGLDQGTVRGLHEQMGLAA